MNWFTRLFFNDDTEAPAVEVRDTTRYESIPWGADGTAFADAYNAALGGMVTKAGTYVTPESAMRASAVYAAIRLLSETIGSLPLIIYKRLPNGGREKAREHSLFNLLRYLPNDENTAGELKEAAVAHLNLRGNAYWYIGRDGAGEIRELIPMHPDHVLKFR